MVPDNRAGRGALGPVRGKLVVVNAEAGVEAAKSRAAGAGAVLVIGNDADAVGGLVASLRAAGARAAGFVVVGDVDAAVGSPEVAEMAAELFPDCDVSLCPP